MLAFENVVSFSSPSVYEDIRIWLNSLKRESDKTAVNYEIDIRQFFKIMINKDIENLKPEDLKFRANQINRYIEHLKDDLGYANSTINRKINSLKSLYKMFERNEYDVNINIFNIKPLSLHDQKSYGNLLPHEVIKMIDIVQYTRKGLMKSVFIQTAATTAFRLSALLSITWKDLQQENGVWYLEAIDKGKKRVKKSIDDYLYQRIQSLKDEYEYTGEDDNIFKLDKKTVNKMMNDLCEKLEIDPERNITFHSFKKFSMDAAWYITKDVKKVATHGNHSSFSTTLKSYLDKNIKLEEQPSYLIGQQLLNNKEAKIEKLNELSKEELINIIKECSLSTQMEILNKTES
jgi:integrase